MRQMSKRLLTIMLMLATAVPALAGQAERLVERGVREMNSEEYAGAIKLFERAIRADAGSVEAFFQLGYAHYQRAFLRGSAEKADKEDARRAVEAFETALALEPRLGSLEEPFLLYHSLAQCHEALGRYKPALNAIGKAARASPRNPMPHLYAARLRHKMKNPDMASANLRVSVRRARRVDAYPHLARLIRSDSLFSGLLEIPQNEVILDAYEAVEAGALTEDEAEERIRGFDSLRDSIRDVPTETISEALDAPLKDPRVVERLEAADSAYRSQRYREAIDYYDAALMADERKGTLDGRAKARIYERIAASYRHVGLAGEAIDVLEDALTKLPASSSAYYELALCHSLDGRLSDALSYLEKSLKNAYTREQLRKTLLLARTDDEFEPLWDLPRFQQILTSYSDDPEAGL
ncbi:MAG: tetratricopeptide repeat protein [Elusimicrobiota bacterium]